MGRRVPDVSRLRSGTGVMVGGCYVRFVDWVNSNAHGGRVLCVRGDLGPYFSGWVDVVGVWVSSRGAFVDVPLGELVAVHSVNASRVGFFDVPGV